MDFAVDPRSKLAVHMSNRYHVFMMNIPTLITWFRIASVPLFFITFSLPYNGSHWFAVTIFILAAFSDWLDGYLARYLSQSSLFGAFLDPVADKLLVVTALILILLKSQAYYLTLPATIIIGREITVSALREWMATTGHAHVVTVSYLSKIKTLTQLIASTLLLICTACPNHLVFLTGVILLYLSAIFTLISMIYYFKIAWPQLIETQQKNQ